MTAELGLNLAGVERVLDLEREIEAMHDRMEQLELEALQAQVRMAEELERVRSSFRAELVPSARAKLELVRASEARSPFPAIPRRKNSNDGPGGKDAA
jgi:MerR family transcriptional regulator/heat shock protein HspR